MDISQLLPEHQELMKNAIHLGIIDKPGLEKIYNAYLELSKIPKKDWDKQSTRDKLKEIKTS